MAHVVSVVGISEDHTAPPARVVLGLERLDQGYYGEYVHKTHTK